MILDGLLTFTGNSNGATGGIQTGPQTDSPTTGTQVASNIIDLGVISGVPSSANGGGARDIGTGDDPSLKLSAIVTTAFANGTSLGLILSGAPDNGSGAPGSYTVMWQSPAVVVEANLIAGRQLANIDVPRPAAGQVMPRYLQLSFVSVGTHNAGAIEAQIVIDRDDQVVGPTGAYSGYVAGINVAN
jgi:hypothetical protein